MTRLTERDNSGFESDPIASGEEVSRFPEVDREEGVRGTVGLAAPESLTVSFSLSLSFGVVCGDVLADTEVVGGD